MLQAGPARLLAVTVSGAFALNLFGFQVLSYVPDALGYESRVVTIPFRAFMLALFVGVGLLAICNRQLRPRLSVAAALLGVFWLLYLLRLVLDTVIFPQLLELPPAEYALYMLGVSLPALVVFFMVREGRFYSHALGFSVLLLAIACAMALYALATEPMVLMRATTNPLLNPITLGHTGAAAMLLGLFLAFGLQRDSSRTRRLFGTGLAAAGLIVLLFAAARGPLLATAVLLPALLLLAWRAGRRLPVAALVALLVLALPLAYAYVEARGLRLEMYIGSVEAVTGGTSAVARYSLYEGAWIQFKQSPLLGSSLIERGWLTYPHNAVLEAFMATGLIGGLCFSLLLSLGAVRAIRLIRHKPEMGWISLLYFQVVIGHMLSFSLYFAPWLWGLLGVMLGLSLDFQGEQTTGRRARAGATA